jgi:predicted enzyme related to lactoylglutathione lyase
MPERAKHEPGTPSWIDVSSRDLPATKDFYTELFGWELLEYPVEEAGGYGMFQLRGKNVAGFGPLMDESAPPAWTTYITVADAEETTAKVERAGGKVLLPPMQVMAAGKMAVYADPTGGVFSVWEPGEHIGAELVNEPGSLTWNELTIRDAEVGKDFYTEVFGWKTEQVPMRGFEYTVLRLGERGIGGLMPMGDEFPPEMPTHWMVYIAVDDADATAKRAEELGGTISVPPTDIPEIGRFAVLNGPSGEVFSILKNAGPTD